MVYTQGINLCVCESVSCDPPYLMWMCVCVLGGGGALCVCERERDWVAFWESGGGGGDCV